MAKSRECNDRLPAGQGQLVRVTSRVPQKGGGMYRVTRAIDFCYGHRLLNYEGKCRHLHGHNGRAVITIQAEQLDARGMVLDFGEIKQTVQGWIDQTLDHRMILCRDDPAVPFLQQLNEPICLIDANPTAETIARMIYEFTSEQGYPVLDVRLWETPRCYATYGPSPTDG